MKFNSVIFCHIVKMKIVKKTWSLNILLQGWHRNKKWVLLCILRLFFPWISFPHWSHWNIDSWAICRFTCVSICFISFDCRSNSLGQCSHFKFFLCTFFIWYFKELSPKNSLAHISHLSLLSIWTIRCFSVPINRIRHFFKWLELKLVAWKN